MLTRSAHAANVLLGRFRVGGTVLSCRGFGRRRAITNIIGHLLTNRAMTIISSTKAPNVSSPNFLITHRTMGTNTRIVYLPNTATFIPTLITSKLPYSHFYFRKFLPIGGNHTAHLTTLISRPHALVFCRSPRHIIGALTRFVRIFKTRHRISIYHRVSGVRRRDIHNALRRIRTRFIRRRPHNRFIVILTNTRRGGGGGAGRWRRDM